MVESRNYTYTGTLASEVVAEQVIRAQRDSGLFLEERDWLIRVAGSLSSIGFGAALMHLAGVAPSLSVVLLPGAVLASALSLVLLLVRRGRTPGIEVA